MLCKLQETSSWHIDHWHSTTPRRTERPGGLPWPVSHRIRQNSRIISALWRVGDLWGTKPRKQSSETRAQDSSERLLVSVPRRALLIKEALLDVALRVSFLLFFSCSLIKSLLVCGDNQPCRPTVTEVTLFWWCVCRRSQKLCGLARSLSFSYTAVPFSGSENQSGSLSSPPLPPLVSLSLSGWAGEGRGQAAQKPRPPVQAKQWWCNKAGNHRKFERRKERKSYKENITKFDARVLLWYQ